ncbi:carboxypeptidase-like regulatory domain-containing protein, partial [Phocaeicola coprocola]
MKDRKNSSLLRRLEKFQRLFFVALLSVLAVGAFAQSKTVLGTVLDKTGESVIGASVVVKGTTNGTITDFDGKFTLQNVPDNGTIQVSFVGYKTVDIQVKGQSTVKIILEEDTETLDEVVVVGYGVQKKSDVTGAMARV